MFLIVSVVLEQYYTFILMQSFWLVWKYLQIPCSQNICSGLYFFLGFCKIFLLDHLPFCGVLAENHWGAEFIHCLNLHYIHNIATWAVSQSPNGIRSFFISFIYMPLYLFICLCINVLLTGKIQCTFKT